MGIKKNLADGTVETNESENITVATSDPAVLVDTKISNKNRYKVSEDMVNGLDFPDLPMTFSNGASRPLHVAPGQFIPDELLNEKDLKLSEFGGCIFRCLNAGWLIDVTAPIVNIPDPKPEITIEEREKSGYTLVETLSPETFAKMRDATATVSVMRTDGPQRAVSVENIKFDGSMPVKNVVIDNRGDDRAVGSGRNGEASLLTPEKRLQAEKREAAGQIRNYQEFEKLTHFAKLDVVAHTLDVGLLKLIAENSEIKQLHNNANGRLREMGQTPIASKVAIA